MIELNQVLRYGLQRKYMHCFAFQLISAIYTTETFHGPSWLTLFSRQF